MRHLKAESHDETFYCTVFDGTWTSCGGLGYVGQTIGRLTPACTSALNQPPSHANPGLSHSPTKQRTQLTQSFRLLAANVPFAL